MVGRNMCGNAVMVASMDFGGGTEAIVGAMGSACVRASADTDGGTGVDIARTVSQRVWGMEPKRVSRWVFFGEWLLVAEQDSLRRRHRPRE